MMSTWSDKRTKETEEIERALAKEFPGTQAYRQNSASIRIRILDDRFNGKSRTEREDMVIPLIRKALSEEVQADITVLVLLTNKEVDESMMNVEFENPTPSNL